MSHQITVLVFVLFFTKLLSQTDSVKSRYTPDSALAFEIPLFNTGSDESENGQEQQDVSGLLKASRDLFTQFASVQFGPGRFRARGLGAAHHQVLINGVDMANPETGVAAWSNWGGLNDMTRFAETRTGVTSSRYGAPGAGGYTNIDTRSSQFKRGTRVSYASSSRIYRHRLLFSQSTGLGRKGWSFTCAGSGRTGEETGVPGTYFRALALFFSGEKKFALYHFISLGFFAAPLEQGKQGAATLETYKLADDNNYNSSWGLQSGKVRNAKVSTSNLPAIYLTHVYRKDQTGKSLTTLFFQAGKSGNTGIYTGDAPNPQPDYYKYLPSYAYLNGDTASGDAIAAAWQNDPSVSQLNWDQMIKTNQGNLYTPPSEAGQVINTTETRGLYILEKRLTSLKQIVLSTAVSKKRNNWYLSAGANGRFYEGRKYKLAEDLLGASFWIDVDEFASGLGVEDYIKQNDIDQPNRKVRQGEKFGYDYSISLWKAEAWSQAELRKKRIEFYLSVAASLQNVWRNGHVANGKFPTTSKGKSATFSMPGGGFRSGLVFRINGRNYFSVNAALVFAPPPASNIFVSPAVRNDMVQGLQPEKRTAADISFHHNAPYLKYRLTCFLTDITDQLSVRTYWHDVYNTTVNQIIKNMHTLHQGIEACVEKQVSGRHIFQLVCGWAHAVYKGQPTLEAWRDNDNTQLLYNEKTYLDNYRCNSSPQLASGASYRFNSKKSWYAALAFNYFDQLYVDVNPYRRTKAATGKFVAGEEALLQQVIKQEKLPSWTLLNVSAGKSFRIKESFLSLTLSVNNILNNRKIITNGFEQLRFDPANPTLFANKYAFLPGRSYMFITTFNF